MSQAKDFLLVNQHYKDLNPIVFGVEECKPGHFYGPGIRFYYLIHYVVSGCGFFRRGTEERDVHAGQIFVARPGDSIYYKADEKNPWTYIWIGFVSSLPLPEAMLAPCVTSNAAAEIFPAMLSSLEAPDTKCPELILTAKLWELVASFPQAEENDSEQNYSGYVLRAKNAIETEYMKDISVSELAERLHLDRSYFSSIFKRDVGVSPQEYLSEIRLKTAASLLTKQNYPPSLAASACGYSDISHFSRMFRRKFGVSPREYRAKLLSKKGSTQ